MYDWYDTARLTDPPAHRTESPFPTPPTMLAVSEVQLLRWLARTHYTGDGAIVELGCWLGGSTASLVTGLRENPHLQDATTRVDTYDNFLWHTAYDRPDLGLVHKWGEDFTPDFERVMGPWRSQVTVHAGDIKDATWDGRPIEILFIDLMKDADATRAVAATFFPHVMPDRTWIVHQDFKHFWTYWLHITMYRLRRHFVPVLNIGDAATLVFKSVSLPSEDEIQKACDFSTLTRTEADVAFDHSLSMIEGSTPHMQDEVLKARDRARSESVAT